LVLALQRINPHPNPKVNLEQYTIPADLAAEILFAACYVHNDIKDKTVLDLGTGTGRLAVGASILGARYVVGVDVEASSLNLASTLARSLGVRVDFVLGEIGTLHGSIDTVLTNPPFGTKKPHADLRFLKCALQLGSVIYTIHKSSTRRFLERWSLEQGLNSELIMATKMDIPHQFRFHRKPRRQVEVDIFRITPT
jgi:putative methylase